MAKVPPNPPLGTYLDLIEKALDKEPKLKPFNKKKKEYTFLKVKLSNMLRNLRQIQRSKS